MNKAEKKVLRVLAKVAHKNAENKDLSCLRQATF